jgi:hypothetical protein
MRKGISLIKLLIGVVVFNIVVVGGIIYLIWKLCNG